MNLVLKTNDRALISFTGEELIAITNALNELCHGVRISNDEFQTRLGMSRESAKRLLDALLSEAHANRQVPELAEVWEDNGSVMVRVQSVFGDPIEMSEVEAVEFAGQLQRAISQAT